MTSRSYLGVFLVGFLMPFVTGFLGLMPLDQSVIFEAAGRISRGEMPYRDISFPYGLVPALMQALLFKAGGTTWFTYVFHAALINGFFAVIAFDILLLLLPRQRKFTLVAGALLAAWGFYPMTGTPFMDNHSFFFSVLAWWCCLAAFSRKQYYLFIVCFVSLAAGFYSKPIPLAFWIFPILMECIFNRTQLKAVFVWLLVGMITGITLLFLPAFIFPTENFIYYSFTLPSGIGKIRMGESFVSRFAKTIKYFKVFIVCLIPFLLYLISSIKTKQHQQLARFSVIMLITIITGVLTDNSFYNFTTPVFILAFVVFDILLKERDPTSVLQRLFGKISILFWILLFVGISILNLRREIDIRFSLRDLKKYSEELGFFVKTPLDRHKKDELEKLKRLISEHNAVYTGDSQFLFSLSGKNNPLPVTHLNDGTTYNSRDSVHYTRLRKRLLENLTNYKTELIINDITWHENQQLVEFVNTFRGEKIDSFGLISVYRISNLELRIRN